MVILKFLKFLVQSETNSKENAKNNILFSIFFQEYGRVSHRSTHNRSFRVEAPITHHLRDFAPNLEKYKAVLFLPM